MAASQIIYGQAAGRTRPSGGGARCTGSGGRRRPRRRSWSGSAARPTTRASSPRSIPTPTRTRSRCCGGDALLVALDQVQDPRNLGAVCRSAEFAGAAGVVIPERRAGGGHRRRLQGLGRRGRAPRGRPRPQPRRLARAGEGGRLLDLGRRRRARTAPWDVDLSGSTVLVLGGEGKGLRPRVASACDGLVALPRRGRVESLNVSAAAAALLFEAVRQRAERIASPELLLRLGRTAGHMQRRVAEIRNLGLTELRRPVNMPRQ